jgi:hypothetical protein
MRIGYKMVAAKYDKAIVALGIPNDAKVLQFDTHCRTDKAFTLAIWMVTRCDDNCIIRALYGSEPKIYPDPPILCIHNFPIVKSGQSFYDPEYTYKVGSTQTPSLAFNTDNTKPNASGIHFYDDYKQAVNYMFIRTNEPRLPVYGFDAFMATYKIHSS